VTLPVVPITSFRHTRTQLWVINPSHPFSWDQRLLVERHCSALHRASRSDVCIPLRTVTSLNGARSHFPTELNPSSVTMTGPYQNFPQDFAGMFPPYFNDGQGQPSMQSSDFFSGNPQYQQSVLDNTSFPDFEEPNRPVLPAQGSARVRKRVDATGEHVKFRRTRSGCYTCRNRRVKVLFLEAYVVTAY
jgi:hypothetical protein